MTTDESIKLFGLVPSDEALPTIREILQQQAVAERDGRDREADLARLCAVQLFSRGLLEDVLLIWGVKMVGMDLACEIDVQLLCGAGLEETQRYLASLTGSQAASALAYINECGASGDFEDFSPASRLEMYKDYFGVGRA